MPTFSFRCRKTEKFLEKFSSICAKDLQEKEFICGHIWTKNVCEVDKFPCKNMKRDREKEFMWWSYVTIT